MIQRWKQFNEKKSFREINTDAAFDIEIGLSEWTSKNGKDEAFFIMNIWYDKNSYVALMTNEDGLMKMGDLKGEYNEKYLTLSFDLDFGAGYPVASSIKYKDSNSTLNSWVTELWERKVGE